MNIREYTKPAHKINTKSSSLHKLKFLVEICEQQYREEKKSHILEYIKIGSTLSQLDRPNKANSHVTLLQCDQTLTNRKK